ncbi:MAG: hypothetical protein LUD84_11540 [Clostridiales bacterium]|nr:hypothetical protein [Clostridiales bacterium]
MNDIQIRKVAFGGYHREDVEKVLSQWQSAAAQQKEALRTAQTERGALTEERNALEQERDDLRAELDETNRQYAALQAENAALQTTLNKQTRENRHLAVMLREFQKSCNQLADELETQETALEEQRRLFDELLQEYGKLEDKLERCNQAGRLAKEGGSKAAQALTGVAARLQEIRSQVQEVDAALDRDGPGGQ